MAAAAERNKAQLREFMQRVWNAGDVAACDEFLAAQYTIRHDPGDPWDGQTLDVPAFKARVRASRAPFPDQRFDIQHLLAEGDAVACSWRWSGTHLGTLAQFAPTGAPFTMSGITLYFFAGERICGHWQVVDRLTIYQQLQRTRGGTA